MQVIQRDQINCVARKESFCKRTEQSIGLPTPGRPRSLGKKGGETPPGGVAGRTFKKRLGGVGRAGLGNE